MAGLSSDMGLQSEYGRKRKGQRKILVSLEWRLNDDKLGLNGGFLGSGNTNKNPVVKKDIKSSRRAFIWLCLH